MNIKDLITRVATAGFSDEGLKALEKILRTYDGKTGSETISDEHRVKLMAIIQNEKNTEALIGNAHDDVATQLEAFVNTVDSTDAVVAELATAEEKLDAVLAE